MTQFPSVVCSFEEPHASEQVVHKTVERDSIAVAQGKIPFVTGPGFAFPPVAGKAPGAGFPEHFTLHVIFSANQAHWLTVFESHGGT